MAARTELPTQLPVAPPQNHTSLGVRLALSLNPEKGYDERGWPKVYATFNVKPGDSHIYWLVNSLEPDTSELFLTDELNRRIPYNCSNCASNTPWLHVALGGEDSLTLRVPLSCFHLDDATELSITLTYRIAYCDKDYGNAGPVPPGLTKVCGPIVSNTIKLKKRQWRTRPLEMKSK